MREWRFTLLSDSYGTLQIEEPFGWDDAELKLVRDDNWHGCFFDYAMPLEFHTVGINTSPGAYGYLINAYNTTGIESEVSLKIEYQCALGEDWEVLGTYRLNFTKAVFTESVEKGCTARFPIEPDSCLMKFRNRYDQKLNIESTSSIDNTSLTPYTGLGIDLELPGQPIRKRYESNAVEADEAQGQGINEPATGSNVSFDCDTYFMLMPSGVVHSEIEEVSTASIIAYTDGSATPLFTLTEGGSGTIDISLGTLFNFVLTSPTAAGLIHETKAEIWLKVRRDGVYVLETLIATATDVHDPALQIDQTPVVDCTFVPTQPIPPLFVGFTHTLTGFDFEAEDEIFLFAFARISAVGNSISSGEYYDYCTTCQISSTPGNYFNFSLDSIVPATTTKAFLVNETLSRAAEIITDDCLRIYSDYYGRTNAQPYASDATGCGSLRAYSNGAYIRRLNNGKNFTASCKDLLEDLNTIDCIGLGLEPDPNRSGYDLLRVERVSHFYDPTIVLTIDGINEVEIEPWTEKHYSIVKNGYAKWEAEEFTGRFEFNTTREWRLDVDKVRNTLTLTCNLIAGSYPIEVTRRQSDTSKDWRFDNDNFIICVETKTPGLYEVEQGGIVGAGGLLFPDDVLNFRISPARNALRWLPLILHSYHDPFILEALKFADGTGNVLAGGMLADACANESDAIAEDSFKLGLAKLTDQTQGYPPYILQKISFKSPLSASDWKLLKANPTQSISIRWVRQTEFVDCFLKSVSYKPNEGEASWTLIRAFNVSDYVSDGSVGIGGVNGGLHVKGDGVGNEEIKFDFIPK